MIKGYYVDLEGCVVTVTEEVGKFSNPWGEVLIEGDTVLTGGWEPEDGFRVDEEYSLWTDLSELAAAIEEK